MAETTKLYRLLRGRMGRYEEDVLKDYAPKGIESKHGNKIMLTRAEAKAMGDRVEFIHDDDPSDEDKVKFLSDDEMLQGLLSSSVEDLREALAGIEEMETLKRLAELEGAASSPRKGALRAIEQRGEEIAQQE